MFDEQAAGADGDAMKYAFEYALGISLFHRAKRVQAKQLAAQWTEAEMQRQWATRCE
ncbi:hypothetical protein [Micromonospora fulviviridis]|uniref:Uncharacterized protein n=1 Tax=Micromonospora fulviviridis TaxID=47860 RepID=A0ABV2VWI9_9ACTN